MHKYISTKVYTLLAVVFIMSGCTTIYQQVRSPDFEALYGPSQPKQRTLAADTPLAKDAISYHKDIKPNRLIINKNDLDIWSNQPNNSWLKN